MATFNLEQSKKIYQDAKSKGLDAKKVIYLMAKDGAVFDGVDMNGILSYGKQNYEPKEAPKQSFVQDVKSAIQERNQNVQDIQGMREQGQSVVGEVLNTVAPSVAEKVSPLLEKIQKLKSKVATPNVAQIGQSAGLVNDILGAGLSAITPDAVKKFGTEAIQKIVPDVLAQAGLNTIEDYNTWAEKNPLTAKNIEGAVNIASLLPTAKAGQIAGTVAKEGLEQGAKVAGEQIAKAGVKVAGVADNVVGKAGKTVGEIVKDTPDALARFVAPNVDPKFATALKKTTKAEVDEMESIVKKAVDNADNPSAFEVVGNKLADATEQVNNQVKSLSQQKKSIISKAKNGLNDFTKETGQAILDINRNLKDSNLAKSFITRLKQVRTKIDADNAIDELQDILYKGNKDMTIPTGSKEDRILKGIIGKYNGELKNGLPASYQKLNDAISNKLDNLDLLNKSLGEVVDGVPTRGASLIKQYFSPSGTKAKELFEFIKKNTGYDVSKDAVLAKYMSEIYGETRAKSFLQGIPTTAQGTIDKLLDFALDKTGVAGKVSDLSKKGQVLKAKSIAK